MTSNIEFRPLDAIGAEVVGVDPENLSAEDASCLYEGWLKYGVLVFKELGTTSEIHLRLSKIFGPLEKHPVESLRVKENEDLIYLGGEGANRGSPIVVDGEVRAGFIYYHQDTSYTPQICKGSMLRMVELPRSAGDTIWVDTIKAYDYLSADIKEKLASLETLQKCNSIPRRAWGRPGMEICFANEGEGQTGSYVVTDLRDVVHPMVIAHPETGKKSLLLSPLGFERVLGMDQEEGDELFESLVAHVTRPEFEYRHKWSVNDLVLWDNRRTMHFATGYPYHDHRFVYRTTLGGGQKTGRYYDATREYA